jgi:hypothetical protein
VTLPANFIARPYRGVAVRDWDDDLDAASVTAGLLGAEAYRRTAFILLRQDDRHALVGIETEDPDPLFSPIRQVELIAGPDDCAFVVDEAVDTANATDLARAAQIHAPGRRVVVVDGRYRHINFIHRTRW